MQTGSLCKNFGLSAGPLWAQVLQNGWVLTVDHLWDTGISVAPPESEIQLSPKASTNVNAGNGVFSYRWEKRITKTVFFSIIVFN